jgi:TonB-linked SusC/RagA family outer membrane protein
MTNLLLFFRNGKTFLTEKNIFFVFFVFLTFSLNVSAQKIVTGKVIEQVTKEPVAGAAISLKSGNIVAVSDSEGKFEYEAKSLPVSLVVTFIGYKKQEADIYEVGAPTIISLQEDYTVLDEVIVTAGGIIRSIRQPGYSTVKLTSAELNAGNSPTISGGLTAKIPGLQVNAISSGVNPNYRLVLRGSRSINGNNEALIVVDGAIVDNAFLGNINPQDIEDIQVLNGASGAALYGSEASNGVIIVTTKKGAKGKPQIKLSHAVTFEQVNFFPKLQTRFGQGSTADGQIFDPIENQQYGPAFDGSLRDLGYPLENGEQQQTTYAAKDDRNKFWETGLQNQTDLSFSFGNDNSTSYVSAQYFDVTGTTPGDKYNRISLRLNNTQKILPNLILAYTAGLVENNYDITTATDLIYENLINIPANIPVLSYKDWQNDKWSTPDGWFNPWYENPYWTAANYRNNAKNTYLTGKIELKWDIKPWLSALYRASLSNRYYQSKQTRSKYTYSDYSLSVQGKTNFTGYVYDGQRNWYRLNQDFQLAFKKDLNDLSFNLTLGLANTNKSEKLTEMSATGLVIPGLYNIGNRSGDPSVGSPVYHERNYGVWGDFVTGYKNYLFLHVTGRNDWTSLLSKANRSYFYPSVDASFIPTDAIESLKNSFFDYLKLRVAWSQTGNVNIDTYALLPTFNSSTGYSNGTYFRESSSLVSPDLKPEITTGYEFGTEFRIFKNFSEVQFTYYSTSTTGEAISASIASSSGYSGYLLNTGEVTNRGIETSLRLNLIHTKDWDLHIGANYTHNENILQELYPGVDVIGVNGSGIIFAQKGYPINVIKVTDYARVPEYADADKKIPNPKELVGKVIVDPLTGYPSRSAETVIVGNTIPKNRAGVDFSVRWKDFAISSLFEYRGGYYYAAHNLGSIMDFSGTSARSAYYNRERFVFPNSVIVTGHDADNHPIYEANTNITISDGGTGFWTNSTYNRGTQSNYVYEGDYWKWRELSVSYTLPRRFLNRLTGGLLQKATISLQGRNLFLWTPPSNEYTDPDYSANNNNAIGVASLTQSPPTRYFGGTISLTF